MLEPESDISGSFFHHNLELRPMKPSNEITPQGKAIEIIAGITTEEELAAFVTEAETRKKVLAARDARYAELSAPADEEPEAEEEAPAEATEDPVEDPPPEAEEEPEVFEDEVIIFGKDEFATVGKAVSDKVEHEKLRFVNGQLPKGDVTAKLEEAFKALEQAAVETVAGDTEAVELPVHLAGSFALALQHQLATDQQRRGLSQPSAIDKALIELIEGLTEEIL